MTVKRAVLLSIRPEWCEKIIRGKKTIEIRKTRAKIETPFKCYIYCSGKNAGRENQCWVVKSYNKDMGKTFLANGKVIGEFICDKITKAEKGTYCILPASETQMDVIDYVNYADEKPVYGWHISDLVIYDEPKELSEFSKPCPFGDCFMCKYHDDGTYWEPPCCNYEDWEEIKRPPQSWCYVEEL